MATSSFAERTARDRRCRDRRCHDRRSHLRTPRRHRAGDAERPVPQGLLHRTGAVAAQHTVLPLHLGAIPACVRGILARFPAETMREGDAYLINHPYLGGSPHANDTAVATPVFWDGQLVAFCVSMAHKTDIGGTVPGSCSGTAREIFHEGLHLPAVRWVREHEVNDDIGEIVAANSRAPDVVLGDLRGQLGCTWLGVRRLHELLRKYGFPVLDGGVEYLFDVTEKRVRKQVADWPDGVYRGEATIDDDGVDLNRPITIRVVVHVDGDQILFDFSETDDQALGPANICPPAVRAVCYYCVKCLVDPNLPNNDGLARAIGVQLRPGSLLNPIFPAPVNTYIPTAQVVAEAVFQALAPVEPNLQIAGSGGTAGMSLGHSTEQGGSSVQYELFGSGLGGRTSKDGVSGTSVHVGNSRVTPIEIIESEFPVKILRFELLPDSGGAGRRRGGLGYVREYRIQGPARLSMRGDKHRVAPYGWEGGEPGRTGRMVVRSPAGEERSLPSRVGDVALQAGDIVRIERAGGGGMGSPAQRDVDDLARDLQEGYVTVDGALRDYGVVATCTQDGTCLLYTSPSPRDGLL